MRETIRRCRPLLGTFVEIEAPADTIDAAFAAVARVQALMSFHTETSDLARLRGAVPGRPVSVDAETVEVLRLARELHDATHRLFDVGVGRMLALAGFLPRPTGIDLKRFDGTGADIEIINDTQVCCHRPVLIDLGGIAKGWAVDRAIGVLAGNGVCEALVNAGGDLRTIGSAPREVHVRTSLGHVVAAVGLREAAMATSDNLNKRRMAGGRLTTPHCSRDGNMVVVGGCVTVVAARCVMADAFTKIALADPDMAERLAPRFGVTQIEQFTATG